MIIGDLKTREFAEGDIPTDSPPPYAASPSTDKSSSISRYTQPPSLPHQNHISIRRTGGPLKGTWIINPDLKLPEAVLAPLEPNEVRKNLEIVSDFGPYINAEVWIVGNERSGEVGEEGRTMVESVWPATVNLTCKTGSVKVRMNGDEKHPFRLMITSLFGKVTIALLRTFVGQLTITTRFGPLFLVGSIKSRIATFSDVKNTFKGFIGSVKSSGFGNGNWGGSTVQVDCHHGSVHIHYLDEFDDYKAAKKNQTGFWAKMFGKEAQSSSSVTPAQE